MFGMFISVAVCVAVGESVLVIRPIADALAAGGEYCRWKDKVCVRAEVGRREAGYYDHLAWSRAQHGIVAFNIPPLIVATQLRRGSQTPPQPWLLGAPRNRRCAFDGVGVVVEVDCSRKICSGAQFAATMSIGGVVLDCVVENWRLRSGEEGQWWLSDNDGEATLMAGFLASNYCYYCLLQRIVTANDDDGGDSISVGWDGLFMWVAANGRRRTDGGDVRRK
ncbi:hypothetical protein Acr_18g0005260 [Actinidia rufa]|uniref:Uncharacterized protein n=1 Tax=Actinidia rufa TaxID=165716 RepID=A0A7J0G6E4_9ERIC|nr:hypothetical protein Acr_18g0005260 [Actinidia rufa]